MTPRRPSSIRGRLVRALVGWSVLWCLALGIALWVVVQEEVDELLDDSLQSAAEGLIGPLAQSLTAATQTDLPPMSTRSSGRFVWQVVGYSAGANVLAASRGAPTAPLQAMATPGFSDAARWRVYGLAVGREGQTLYVAQTTAEGYEAQFEIGMAVLLAGLPMALLAMVWLSARVRREMQPLQDLSQRLVSYDPLQAGATLGLSDLEELRPVHAAIDALAARLARRIADERAFTAHAAHALRTPLAGIDAQLAVALREVPAAHQDRLRRIRSAAERLQRVVVALLAMFRAGAEVQRVRLDLPALASRLPVDGITVDVQATQPLTADADLVTAALLNLLDNALRHGARSVLLSTPEAGVLRVQDDGPGVDAVKRGELQAAIDTRAYAGGVGLGLMLADLVARAHGGTLTLPGVAGGFAAELRLQPHA